MDQFADIRGSKTALGTAHYQNAVPLQPTQPPREVAFSVLSEIENITNDGINLAGRIADSLSGSSPSSSSNLKDAPMDLLSKLINLRSAVIELNQQLNRTANALGV